MYLHHFLSKPKSELIRQVHEVQKQMFTKNDWHNLVNENKNELRISLTDEQISKLSKEKFKFTVTQAVERKALDYLNNLASSYSKSENVIKQRLVMENYFRDARFSKSEIEFLLALRTKMVKDIKKNFPSQYSENLTCDLCQLHICCQEHLLSCVELKKQVKIPDDIQFSDIFGSTDKQLRIVRVIKLLRVREILKSE